MTFPFDNRDGFIWLDGALVPWREARLHVLTHGLHYASSVFEGIRVYNGKIFKLREHSERLFKSAELLGFSLSVTLAELEDATKEVVRAQNITNGYIRPIAWRGSEMMAISAKGCRTHLAIAAWEWPSYFSKEARERGLRLQLSPWARPAPNTAPTSSKAGGLYMIATLSKQGAEANGYDDALMYDYRGFLAEATGANLFLVINGELHTPIPDCFLNGITRQTVISLAKKRGITVVERHIPPEELKKAQEIFLTGTAAEVAPVGAIDGTSFGALTYTPGKVTQALIEDYTALVTA